MPVVSVSDVSVLAVRCQLLVCRVSVDSVSDVIMLIVRVYFAALARRSGPCCVYTKE